MKVSEFLSVCDDSVGFDVVNNQTGELIDMFVDKRSMAGDILQLVVKKIKVQGCVITMYVET